MQPHNLAIRALESLPALRAALDTPAVHRLADDLEAALHTAPTFLLPADLFSDKKDVAKLTSLIRLPVDCLFLETDDLALLAMRCPLAALPDSIILWPVIAGSLAPTGFAVQEADLAIAAECRSISTTPLHLLPSGEQFLAKVGANRYFADHLAALGELCALLACRNVTTEVISAPEKLNRARIARGKLPLRGYHTLVLKMTETRHVGSGSPGGHASPRGHVRRGHVRHLPNGPIWVSPALVNPGRGFVGKTYRLQA